MCCGASFFFLRRDDDDEVVCETTLLYLYTKIVDLSRRVFVFFLGCWFIFFEICVDGPFRVVLFVSRFLFGRELTSRHVYIALIYT